MFWKRTTGHGAFTGLLSGTAAALLHHGLTLPADATPGIHGAWIHLVHTLPQRHGPELLDRHLRLLGQSRRHHRRLASSPSPAPSPSSSASSTPSLPSPSKLHLTWYQKPATLGIAVLAMLVALNLVFA